MLRLLLWFLHPGYLNIRTLNFLLLEHMEQTDFSQAFKQHRPGLGQTTLIFPTQNRTDMRHPCLQKGQAKTVCSRQVTTDRPLPLLPRHEPAAVASDPQTLPAPAAADFRATCRHCRAFCCCPTPACGTINLGDILDIPQLPLEPSCCVGTWLFTE